MPERMQALWRRQSCRYKAAKRPASMSLVTDTAGAAAAENQRKNKEAQRKKRSGDGYPPEGNIDRRVIHNCGEDNAHYGSAGAKTTVGCIIALQNVDSKIGRQARRDIYEKQVQCAADDQHRIGKGPESQHI